MAKLGIVLSGGGARGAYQVGVFRAFAELSKKYGKRSPFTVFTGVSAGAINSSQMAAHADDFELGVKKLEALWGEITPDQVFRTDFLSLGRIGFRFIREIGMGSLKEDKRSRALLDTSPLRKLIADNLPLDRLNTNLKNGTVHGIAISATDYGTSLGVTFVDGNPDIPLWQRSRRVSVRSQISVDHVLASASIPLFFPPVKIGDRSFGDGCLRNTAPLSPSIHLGADQLIVVGVRKERAPNDPEIVVSDRVSMARVLSVILNAVMMDGIDVDIERLTRINQTVRAMPTHAKPEGMVLKPIDFAQIHPSHDIGLLAKENTHLLPKGVRYLLGGLGSKAEGSEIISYLLFHGTFTKALMDLGYRDCMAKRVQLEKYIETAYQGLKN